MGALTSFPAGWLADRLGVRWTLLGGPGARRPRLRADDAGPGYPGLLALVVLAGIGFGAVNPTSTKGVLAWFPARSRATAVGVKQAGFPLGGALGALTLPTLATARASAGGAPWEPPPARSRSPPSWWGSPTGSRRERGRGRRPMR